jgi:HEAT repeat protein
MVTRNSKAVSSSLEKSPSAASFWPMGMMLLVCAALFVGCAGGPPTALEEALENIESSDEAVRLKGIEALSGLGEEAKPHADKVAALLKDTSAEVRRTAITVLISLEHNSPEFVQELSAMVSGDAEANVQTTALHALLDIGANEQFIKGCKEAIAGDDAAKKGEAIMYLGEAAGGGVAGAKEELDAIAGGSDAEAATAAKDSLKMLEE